MAFFEAKCYLNHSSVLWRIKSKPQQTLFWQIPHFVKQKAVLVHLRCTGEVNKVLQSTSEESLCLLCLEFQLCVILHLRDQRAISILNFECNVSLTPSLQSWHVQNMTWVENPQECNVCNRNMSFNMSSTGGKKRYSNCTESPWGGTLKWGSLLAAVSLWKSAQFHKKGAN